MDFDKYSEGNQLLHDIVHYDRIPTRIQRFWNSLALSGDSPKRWNVISVLNTMLKQEIPEGIDMISWYEIFRDIFLVRAREEESRTRAAKTPRFTTFDRTFEQLAFLPEYWLDCSGDDNGNREKKRPLPDPARLLFSFERYLYNQDGGACWSAIDWGMPKYCFRVVCENRKHPQFNVAALLLTAHCIANGKMGLYVGEKTGVNLPYAGISGEGDTRNPLLKYFHFDRFTRLSFIRKNELVLDADSMSRTPMFEPQWQTPANDGGVYPSGKFRPRNQNDMFACQHILFHPGVECAERRQCARRDPDRREPESRCRVVPYREGRGRMQISDEG